MSYGTCFVKQGSQIVTVRALAGGPLDSVGDAQVRSGRFLPDGRCGLLFVAVKLVGCWMDVVVRVAKISSRFPAAMRRRRLPRDVCVQSFVTTLCSQSRIVYCVRFRLMDFQCCRRWSALTGATSAMDVPREQMDYLGGRSAEAK